MSSIYWRHVPCTSDDKRSVPAVLVHGLFGSLENLAGIAKRLAENQDVYLIDLPEHGRSAHSEQTSLASMAKQLCRWLDEQGLLQIDFVGHSLGGKVAMEVALTEPKRIAKLVVMDIAPVRYSSRHNQIFEGLNALSLSLIDNRRAADAHLIQFAPNPNERQFLLKNLVKSKVEGGNRFEWRLNLPVLTRDYAKLIAANSPNVFNGKVLFIKAEHSDYITESYRDEIVSRFPNASVKLIANTAHWLHAEKPIIVANVITRFLKG